MKKSTLFLALAMALSAPVLAEDKHDVEGVKPLEHVFLIMMENHGYSQIIGNPNAPFINTLAESANLARKYYAVAHPSLTNYLEVVGGSNFGVLSDNNPDWSNTSCTPNIQTAPFLANTDNPGSPAICPIWGEGVDAPTAKIDTTNEAPGSTLINVDGNVSFAARKTVGKTIADQLTEHGRTWKTYQENLPLEGAYKVNYSDGVFTDSTDFSKITPALTPPLSQGGVVKQYAAKHNPFVYFRDVQHGLAAGSLRNIVGFDGDHGLYADLRAGKVPSFAFIAPNQCNDMHGRGNAGPFCNYDPKSDGSQAGLNPALILQGDKTVEKIVKAIKGSPAWHEGRNAIIVMWDENDYSIAPNYPTVLPQNTNRVAVIVDTNYGKHGVKSDTFYTHFSLFKSLEAAFELPCINHGCDKDVKVMSDLLGSE